MEIEAYDARILSLNEGQITALRGVNAFMEATSLPDLVHEHGLLAAPTALATAGLMAAIDAVQSGLPLCPYAPSGHRISTQFLPPDNRIVLRCDHTPTAHCWESFGERPSTC